MQPKRYTVEELMLNDSFLAYCLDKQAADKLFWEKETRIYRDQQEIFAEARYTILLLHGKLDDNEVTRQVEKIKKLIANREAKNSPPEKLMDQVSLPIEMTKRYTKQRAVTHVRKTFWKYGVVVSVLALFALYISNYTVSKVNQPKPDLKEVSYYSGIGERKTIQLPDQSVAVLNSNSSITLAGDFNQNKRTIRLKGEAFFRVAKNAAKPFIVHSGDFSVTAVGTAFYVHSGNNGNDYKVDLLEGKVRLEANENTMGPNAPRAMLLPGEEGAWQFSKMSFIKSSCDSALLRKWIAGKLSFKNMPVENVLELLRQWYGVDITAKHPKWGNLTLTGDYDNKPLDHVLKIICFSLSASYSYSHNRDIIE